jgi:hypothetical protein
MLVIYFVDIRVIFFAFCFFFISYTVINRYWKAVTICKYIYCAYSSGRVTADNTLV